MKDNVAILLLLLAAPTWLWGRCGRHSSPQASSVMDLVFRRSYGSHVSVDTVHPSQLRSTSLSSPGWYHLQSLSSDAVLVSPLYVVNPPQSRFPGPLCDTLYLQSLLDVFVSRMVSKRAAACPSAHLHFCHFQFLHVGAIVTGTVSIPYSIAGCTIILWIFPFTCGGTVLSQYNVAI